MYQYFKTTEVNLDAIDLDRRNPRLVTQKPLVSDDEILRYLFEYEDLLPFLKRVASEGKNPGAERPYLVKNGGRYTVVEGNTRIAAYKILTGQLNPPSDYMSAVPTLSHSQKAQFLKLEVVVAPSRDSLKPIMARSHFGRGEKSQWGYLGSRKAVYDDWKSGQSVQSLSNVYMKTPAEIREYILEYLIFLEALKLSWTPDELAVLTNPSIKFNPPVRFLQSTGHKQLIGMQLDKNNLSIKFIDENSKRKFKHLIKKTVILDDSLSAVSSYSDVFSDYEPAPAATLAPVPKAEPKGGALTPSVIQPPAGPSSPSKKKYTLFAYEVKNPDLALRKLMREASSLNVKNYAGAGTALLRALLELVLKLIIEKNGLNPDGKMLDLEASLNLVLSKKNLLSQDDIKILKEFKSQHLSYVNLSTHATVVPNYDRLMMCRDCIDAFMKRNVL